MVADNVLKEGSLIEYEQHSKPILGVVLAPKREKWSILNQDGGLVDLSPDRLAILPGKIPESCLDNTKRAAFLTSLARESTEKSGAINLADVWQLFYEDGKEVSVEDVSELLFPDCSVVNYISTRRALLLDRIYFKRRKNSFEPRPPETVESLKVQLSIEQEKTARRNDLIDSILKRVKDPTVELPPEISLLEQLAVFGSSAPSAQEGTEILDNILQKRKIQRSGRLEELAFSLLCEINHFSVDQNLSLIRLGRPSSFTKQEISAAEELSNRKEPLFDNQRLDLRDIFCITIDGENTLDFDDALSCEKTETGYRFGIHITDAASSIEPGSLLEQTALRRSTSIYCPDQNIPMLPEILSEKTLSLLEGCYRAALSFIIETDQSLNISTRRIERSLIQVKQRLTYDQVDAILCEDKVIDPRLNSVLLSLLELSNKIEARRLEAGALQFDRRELSAKLAPDGLIYLQPSNEDTPAHRLVSELMILANETAALFASEHNIPIPFRSQEDPDSNLGQRSDLPPEGPAREFFLRGLLKRSQVSIQPAKHSGLGLSAYTQVTSPLRRALDLITQRQLASFVATGKPCYQPQEIQHFLLAVEQGQEEAALIQRERNRYWLLKYLIQEKIKELPAVIVKVDSPKPLAELELIYMLAPFNPLQNKGRGHSFTRKDLGKRLTLSVKNINPHSGTVLLLEKNGGS